MSKKKIKSEIAKTSSGAVATHINMDDGKHVVGLGNIRVLIVPDGPAWFAQGLEIDYAAQGDSLEEVRREFEEGLSATVEENLRVYGNIKKMLVVAPSDIWCEAMNRETPLESYSQVSFHRLIQENTNFNGIKYLVAKSQNITC